MSKSISFASALSLHRLPTGVDWFHCKLCSRHHKMLGMLQPNQNYSHAENIAVLTPCFYMNADSPAAKRVNMADAESPHRSVRTDSRQRITYGISVAVAGGKLRLGDQNMGQLPDRLLGNAPKVVHRAGPTVSHTAFCTVVVACPQVHPAGQQQHTPSWQLVLCHRTVPFVTAECTAFEAFNECLPSLQASLVPSSLQASMVRMNT